MIEFTKNQIVTGTVPTGPKSDRAVSGKYVRPKCSFGELDGNWYAHEVKVDGNVITVYNVRAA